MYSTKWYSKKRREQIILNIKFSLSHFFSFGGPGIWTQGLQSRPSTVRATPPVHFALVILEMGSYELFA
jgi:hypothetical protein